MTNQTKTQNTARLIESKFANAQQELRIFAEKLATDPAYAMTWADSQFKFAAEFKIYGMLMQHLAAGMTHDDMIEDANDYVARMCRYVESSSSTSANMMERATLAVWGEIADPRGMFN